MPPVRVMLDAAEDKDENSILFFSFHLIKEMTFILSIIQVKYTV